jgi:hypothetical protein
MGRRNPESMTPTMMLRIAREDRCWLVICYHCRRKAVAPVDLILRRYGERTPIAFVQSKLRCTRCRKMGAEIYLALLPGPV